MGLGQGRVLSLTHWVNLGKFNHFFEPQLPYFQNEGSPPRADMSTVCGRALHQEGYYCLY